MNHSSEELSIRTMLRVRLKAFALHLVISLLLALIAGVLVFHVWYPYPYREISGGKQLFLLIVTTDVMLGPLATLFVFSGKKSRVALWFDFTIIGLLQLLALGYGMWAVFVARPVHLVFEYDRFRVIHAIDIPDQFNNSAPQGVSIKPWDGPTLISLRPFKSNDEQTEATLMALAGVELGARPDLWQSYDVAVNDVLKEAKSVGQLRMKFPNQSHRIDEWFEAANRDATKTVYLPLIGRNAVWTMFLDSTTAEVVGTMPLDSF